MTPIHSFLQSLVVAALSFATCVSTHAESWPPLRAPDPLTVEWVIKQTLTRFPEVHARHRAYLAALARVDAVPVQIEPPVVDVAVLPRLSDDVNSSYRKLKHTLAEREADIVFADALEHHMQLQWQAHNAFWDYALAQEAVRILENQKRLTDAYLPATQARIHSGANDMVDLGLESARISVELLLRLGQDKLNASWRMNTLMDRNWEALLTPVKLGEPTQLPADREAMVGRALKHSPAARKSRAQVAGAVARQGLAKANDKAFLPLAAVTHELAGAEDQRRAVNTMIVRDVTVAYENARVKLDITRHHNHTIVPRVRQLATAGTAGYRNRQITITELIKRYREQADAEMDALSARIDYEKSLADLAQFIGVLPDYAIRTMSERPLNTSREPRAQ